LIGYATAVTRVDGMISFYQDIYGHDCRVRECAVAVASSSRR
jgi:murein L,D-transpeptidase YcbB/YkuD